MDQSDTPQTQVLQSEGSTTDVDAQTIHVTEIVHQEAKVATTIAATAVSTTTTTATTTTTTEDSQDLQNVCKLQQGSTPSANNTDSNVESKLDDCVDGSNSDTLPDKVHSDTTGHLTCDSHKLDGKVDTSESIDIYEHIKDEIVDPNYELQSLSNKEDQSLNVITESKEKKKDAVHIVNNVIEDSNQSNAVDEQVDKASLDKSVSDNSEVQICHDDESVEKKIKEIHGNDSNQNSSIVTNAELTKLVNKETVVLEETTPVASATADNFVINVGEKNASSAHNQETLSSLQEKKPVAGSGHDTNEATNLINYSQESGGTIIEVIATKGMHSPEQQRNSENHAKSNKCDIGTTKLTDGEVVAKKSIKEKDSSKGLVNSISKEDNANMETTAVITDKKIISTKDVSPETTNPPRVENVHEYANKGTNDTKETDTPVADSTKKRSVIQDIFDDWGVENTDEDAQSTSKEHDSVEIELKSLLDEPKSDQPATNPRPASEEATPQANKERGADSVRSANATETNTTKKLAGQTENQKKSKAVVSRDATSLDRNEKDPAVPAIGRSLRTFNATPHTATHKNRTRHLTSQIASPAEVTEVLKERLREKQKVVVDAPRTPDIFFVKKLTQRLSSKLAGNPIPSPANPMSSLPQQPAASLPSSTPAPLTAENCDKSATTGNNTATETSKDGNSDSKELLAILEGDVDPDWSILKPPTLTEEGKTSSNVEQSDNSIGPPKLDPLIEREMALKQLLELPVASSKKNVTRKKKTFKPAPGKASRDSGTKNPVVSQDQKKVIDIDLPNQNACTDVEDIGIDLDSPSREQNSSLKDQDVEQINPASRTEESRAGRKRKLTEKAREHEHQTTIKRQKVYKGKVSINKKQDTNVASNDDSTNDSLIVASTTPEIDLENHEEEVENKQLEDKAEPTLNKLENSPLKRPKQSLTKKGSQPITKRKVVVKKLLRQKISPNKKTVKLKAKLNTSPKKSPTKVIPKTQPKRAAENSPGDAKPKKKNINEIDRLLQDEGVVNLLYDVEQPDKKRLVPITKSRAKVMDLQKVQRELKIRKKLVRNAVLRLRTSSGSVTKVSPRSKRTAGHPSDATTDKKQVEQVASQKTPNATTPTEFILPAKIRNAADASIIVRRHSSSSFSSASGSPRVSVDTPDKSVAETAKLDDSTIHSLRSAKRRHSQDEKINVKKSKKKAEKSEATDTTATSTSIAAASVTTSTTTTTTTTTNATANIAEEKAIAAVRPSKKSEIKKVDKAAKQQEHIPALENSVTSSKVTTRSNGAATGKITAKNKKAVKSKVSFVKPSEAESSLDSSKEEAELSACLAEAATALAIVNAGRSGNNANTRKNKVNTTVVKMLELGNTKTEAPGQFRNKEINVRRHGNLVQLILTPSSSTRVRNALTLQVMQEFKEALLILNRDEKCRVVLLTSTGTSFCEGLELSTLLRANKEERRSVAQELATAVKDFIKSLATFNKPIVAGVQGAAIGLGVTMLPLFDLVIASDKATFCTPYAKLGQIAEGAAVYTLSHILGSPVTSELLLGGRTLTASEALRAGLVTRVLWPDRFQVELLPSLRAMGEQSSQSMEATKALLRHSLRKKLDAALESETYLLTQQWCSAECQTAIKAYIDGKIQ
ncbi:serine-rich adhesin for platelets-like isoform X2 [Odontomachus brunneus]|uniref:serine-rich adhesin for platelets-like isoform X2 n=1 Tax=Odontomachus brunneus TaxID=486640 RepID=UPI0013F22711|nr:serine-rich adhesin for platelets-like isoform X2 [Odontomachus brunneus]